MANVEVTVELVDRMSKDMRKIEKRLDKLDRNVKDTGKSSRKTAKQAGGLGSSLTKLGVIAGSVTAAVFTLKKGFDFAEQGAQLLRLEKAGETLAENFGSNMDAMVRSIQDASQGTISRMDAIRAANQAMQLGVAKTPEEFEQLTKSAVALGQAMGVGPVQAIRDITTGIGRMSPLILDNLGITTKGGAIYDEYAASIGKTTQELTDTEKKQVLLNAALESANKLLDENGEVVLDTASAYDKLGAETSDAADRFKKEFAVAVEPVVKLLADTVGGANDLNEALALMDNRIAGAHRGMFILKDGTVVSGDALIQMMERSRESGEAMRNLKSAGLTAAEGYSAAGEAADTAGGKISDFTTAAIGLDVAQQMWEDFTDSQSAGGEALTIGEQNVLIDTLKAAGADTEGLREEMLNYNKLWDDGLTKVEVFGERLHEDVWVPTEKLTAHPHTIVYQLEVEGDLPPGGGGGGGTIPTTAAQASAKAAAEAAQQQRLEQIGSKAEAFGQHGLNFEVPPGFQNDSFRIGVSTGEHVAVTPKGRNSGERSAPLIGQQVVNFGGGRGEMDEFQAFERMMRRL